MAEDNITNFAYGQIRGAIQPTPGGIEPPKNIICSVQAARTIYNKYRAQHLKRINLYAQIEGLIAGNAPYNAAELQKFGLMHIANFNDLTARSLYKKAALAYWNLLNQTETLVKFEVDIDDPEQVHYAQILAKNWDYVIRQWPDFTTSMSILSAQIVKFGVSPILWYDERDFRWRAVELSKFFIEDMAQSLVSELTAVCVETSFTAQYLFQVWESIKDLPKEKSPWDKEELERLLLYLANQFAKTPFDFVTMMDLQQRYQNGDTIFEAMFSDSIKLISLFYKDYDGKISHYMFHRTFDGGTGSFLFFADRQYENIEEAFIIFTATPGETTVHSNRGTGHELYSICQALMQMDCSIVDMTKWSSTPMVKSTSVGSKDFEQIRFYPGVPTNIGTAEFVQNNLGANISGAIAAANYFGQKLQANLANGGSDPSYPDSDKGSIAPSQARAKAFKEFGVLKNSIAHFYSLFDRVVKNMTIKMLNSKKGYPGYEYAKEWKERCIADGFPAELFDIKRTGLNGLPYWLRSAKASRVAGDGSTLARIMGLEAIMPIAGDFGPRESHELRREWIMASLGPDYVQTFMQDAGRADEQAGGASLAGMENVAMKMGESPIFSMDNEHRSHLSTHLALGKFIIDSVSQQQMDVIGADKVFTTLVPHLQDHHNAIRNSFTAKAFLAQIENPINQIVKYAQLNRKNAETSMQAQIKKQQEDQAATQQVLSEEERKNIQLKGNEARANYKVQSQVQRASQANATRAEVAKEKIHLDAANQRLKIDLEHTGNLQEIENNSLQQNREMLSGMLGSTPSSTDFEPPTSMT